MRWMSITLFALLLTACSYGTIYEKGSYAHQTNDGKCEKEKR